MIKFFNYVKLYLLLIAIYIIINPIILRAKPIAPITKKVGKLNISVDPRMELIGVIEYFAKAEMFDKFVRYNTKYSKTIQEYFSKYLSNARVKQTIDIFNNNNLHAPINFYASYILNMTESLECPKEKYYDKDILKIINKDNDTLMQYFVDFAKITKFDEFWKQNREYYNKIIDLTIAELGNKDYVNALEDYYLQSFSVYNIKICPSMIGGYGIKTEREKDKFEANYCSMTNDIKDSILFANKAWLENIIWHEYSHIFINPCVQKYNIDSAKALYEPIKGYLEQRLNYYSGWDSFVYEQLVRAATIRLIEINYNKQRAQKQIVLEKNYGFAYIEPIMERFKDYEKERDRTGITFREYFPKIYSVYDSLLTIDYKKFTRDTNTFYGPIKNVWNNILYIIYPTNGMDLTISDSIQKKIISFLYKFKSKDDIELIADSTALKLKLGDRNLVVYGTIESNVFLSNYKNTFPFRFENNNLYADKKYPADSIVFYTCLPHPTNPNNGMVIYTAINNTNLLKLFYLKSGIIDFIISDVKGTIIGWDYYDKEGKNWQFIKDDE